MNRVSESNEARLHDLLHEARPEPALPPRFQEAVWRRIERAEAPAPAGLSPLAALDRWVERLLAPRFAFAIVSLLLAAGGLTGMLTSGSVAKQQAQERYLTAVAPNIIH